MNDNNSGIGLAIASMVLGIVSISMTVLCNCFIPFFPAIFGIISIPLGASALGNRELNQSDRSKAKAGIITSIVSISIQLLFLLIIIFYSDWNTTPFIDYNQSM